MIKPADKIAKNSFQDYADPIAKLVATRYMDAKMYRSTDRLGDVSVDTLLTRSYNQYHSIFDPCDLELVQESGIDAYPSITKKKVNVLVDFMRDLMSVSTSSLITVNPTPMPDLSENGKREAVGLLRQALLDNPVPVDPSDLTQLAKHFKQVQLQKEFEIAMREAKRQERVIHDQLVETNFVDELLKMLFYIARDPYAVMVGPIPRGQVTLAWSGNRMVEKEKVNNFVHVPDPRDYYYAPDAVGNGTGAYELVVEKLSRASLQSLVNAKGWINKNIVACLDHFTRMESHDWLRSDGRENKATIPWGTSDSIQVLRHFGLVSGKELRPFGFSLQDDRFYEIQAITCGPYTLKLEVAVDLTAQQRQIYTTAYKKSHDKVAGESIAQMVRDIERMYLASIRSLMTNMGFSALPMGEVDMSRIQRYMPPESIGQLLSGTMVPVDADAMGGGRPAHYYHNTPNLSGQFANTMSFFEQMADNHTGLPAALSGQPIGTGVNRTFRGIMALYSNAMKGVQSSLMNIDRDILRPVGKAYHYMNRKEHKFVGDAIVDTSGVSGLLQKEIQRQTSMENMQMIAQLASGAPDQLPNGTMQWAVDQLLRSSGVPDNILDAGQQMGNNQLNYDPTAGTQ